MNALKKWSAPFSVRTLVHVGLLIAIEVVLSRFCSISTPYVKIGFGFVPIAVCAMMLGPLWAGVMAALADFLGAILFPIGPYFPGFTACAFLTGVVFGLFLYREATGAKSWGKVLGAVAVNQLVISLLINTLWISLLYGTPYVALLPTRILQCCILIPLQVVVLRVLTRPIALYKHRQYA